MTCKDCKFYENECESHHQMRLIEKERGMEICEIFCKAYVDCIECINFYECNYGGVLTGRLTSCPDYKPKPKTNADRIRAMSDEELAHEFALIAGWDRKQYKKAQRIGIQKVMLDWLQSPVEGE